MAGAANEQEGEFGNVMAVKGRAAARVEEEAGIKNAMSVVQDLNTKEMNDLLLNNGNAAAVATKHHINPSDISTRRALIRAAMKDNTIGDNEELIAKLAGNKDQSINEELANGIRSNKLSAKAIYLDNNFANQVGNLVLQLRQIGEKLLIKVRLIILKKTGFQLRLCLGKIG